MIDTVPPEVLQKLSSMGERHLLNFWDSLDLSQRNHLLQQIEALDPTLLTSMRLQVFQQAAVDSQYDPFLDYSQTGSEVDAVNGLELIRSGKMGCLIVAGGQGTRLRFEGPKGMFPISVVKHKSLFQLFAEKTLAAGKQAGRRLPLAIMTSPQNHDKTVAFFKTHNFFGLESSQLSFFSQGMLPLLDRQGHLFLEGKGSIAEGPDGNGSALAHFVNAGIWDKWNAQGVTYLNFVIIDNALADPFDAELLGFHVRQGTTITMKCTPRRDSQEKVGLLVKSGEKVHVVEYSEMPESERTALHEGKLKHLCANLSLFCCNMDFIKNRLNPMPLHLAFKAVKYVDDVGNVITPKEPMSWKFERFIFDILPMAPHVSALLYPRERCFAPLKNFDGNDSPATVQVALQEQDRALFKKISGIEPPKGPFELAQEFHYPIPDLLQAWKGKPAPTGYVGTG